MKTYKVTYHGNATKYKNFEVVVNAESERKAVESVYAKHLDYNYFPQDDGSIKDCDGEIIADANSNYIDFDGGSFSAKEIE